MADNRSAGDNTSTRSLDDTRREPAPNLQEDDINGLESQPQSRSSPLQLSRPSDENVDGSRYLPPPSISDWNHASSPIVTNLYTVPSQVEVPAPPAERVTRSGRGGHLAGPNAPPVHVPVSPAPSQIPLASCLQQRKTSSDNHVQQPHRLSHQSGVSFAGHPAFPLTATHAEPRLSDIDGFDGVMKPAALDTSASTRIIDTSETLAHYRDWVHRQRERQRLWTGGPYGKIKMRIVRLYRKYIVKGLLRQRPLPPSADGRHIPLDPGFVRRSLLLDERTRRPFISNFIRSSRYTLLNFIPRQLLFQFMKLANFYFLIISILQMIPGLSTTGKYTTILPLLVFVGISMGKEGYDDYRRYRLDRVENRSTVWVLDPDHTIATKAQSNRKQSWLLSWRRRSSKQIGLEQRGDDDSTATEGWVPSAYDPVATRITELDHLRSPGELETLEGGSVRDKLAALKQSSVFHEQMPWAAVEWQSLRVGDIVRLRRDDNVPADMVLLRATGPNGVAYIETMALDGETNLKTKQASSLLYEHCDSLAGMAACGAEIVSEDPNLDLYNYEGRVIVGGQTLPLTLNQIIFRGSILRNTSEAIGIVVNTGEECKIRMNTHRNKHAKAPAMQSLVNRIVMLLVIFVVLLSIGCSSGNGAWVPRYATAAWYLDNAEIPLAQIFFAFIIMFNTLIPLSLYVSLEIIKVGQLLLLQDVEMYDPDTDTPMVANTTTILENLGQVSYVFSDKTGTLTENKMRFRKMSVAGTAWLHDMDIARDEEVMEKRRKSMVGIGRKKSDRGAQDDKHRAKQRKSYSEDPASFLLSSSMKRQPKVSPESSVIGPLLAGHSHSPPKRSISTSQWRSTARPSRAQPELKTEDLLQYIRLRPHTAFSRKARHFILCVALCHTCLPETLDNGEINFQAASPDELALVQAARDLGYLLIDRPAQAIKLQFNQLDGTTVIETYRVLDVVEFSSKRKRMSIVIRMPDGRICLFCKGADSAILPRLKLSQMALQKATAVVRRASKRRSVEQEWAMRRKSATASIAGGHGAAGTPRSSLNVVRAGTMGGGHLRGMARLSMTKRSTDLASYRRSGVFSGEMDDWLTRREMEDMDVDARAASAEQSYGPSGKHSHYSESEAGGMTRHQQHHKSRDGALAVAATGATENLYGDAYGGLVDEVLAVNEGAVFERCFQHIDDFASEGLRTLLFAYRFVEEDDYAKWRTVYHDATTSLVDRQERIESAAELLEQGLDLAGATAIEDKLQQGVPETIDKLRRANIKIWMLTGDKRETAINIAHAARICKPFSEVYVLDAAVDGNNLQERIASTLVDVGRGMMPHSVVVIDGHTLGVVEALDEMRILFFDLVTRVDSVICCRASPSQKATLVKCIRERVPSSMTLAIGDGANDIAMIQASHVGIGISGREGLQAARISDYSIAQFRFLQRLLLVHGRWNYIRTGKYILATFWKELVFYLVQALYQKYNGYTGTSLYESTSLTVFNTLFTSLPVILLGIFDKDLRAETLLAVPELYAYGQQNQGFCFRKYIAWMTMAVSEAAIIFFAIYATYDHALFTSDASLYALGSLAFTDCVVFINIKMLVLEMHSQTIITALGLLVSVAGWFLWSLFMSVIYPNNNGAYLVRGTFLNNFGRSVIWWTTALGILITLIVFELIVASLRRAFFATDQDLMQEMEHDENVCTVLEEHAVESGLLKNSPDDALTRQNEMEDGEHGLKNGMRKGKASVAENNEKQPPLPQSSSST